MMVYLVISGASGDLVSRRRRPEKGERGGYVYAHVRAVPFFIVVGVLVDVNALVRQAAGGHATPPSLREAERSLPPGPKGRWERSEKLIGPCELCRKTLTT